jgi:hypothetical protein
MHTEHLQNLKPTWVVFGWFIGAAVFSLLLMAMIQIGLVAPDSPTSAWVLLAIVLGFGAGGYVIGMRTGAAPILHAFAIGLVSLIFWLLVNLLAAAVGGSTWRSTAPEWVVGGILLQMISAWLGAHIASDDARAASKPD